MKEERDAAETGSSEPSPVQGFAEVPFSVELESTCTLSLPPLVVPELKPFESRPRSADAFELLLEARDSLCFDEWLQAIGDCPQAHNLDAEELLAAPAPVCTGMPQIAGTPQKAGERASLCKAKRMKRERQLSKKKAPSLDADPSEAAKPEAAKELDSDDQQQLSPKVGKSLSEYPTDDSLQAVELFAPHGLAGSLPYFKLCVCTICQGKQFVFWLGDAVSSKKADKFFCIHCIRVQIGEHTLFQILSQGAAGTPGMSQDLEDLPSVLYHGYAHTSKKPETEHEHACLTRLLQLKLAEADRLFARMHACITSHHASQDTLSRLLAVLFLSENIDAQVRLQQILRTSSLQKKLDQLHHPERVYFYREAAKINSFIAVQAILDRARRPSDMLDLYPFYNELKQPAPLAKKPQTLFSFDDKQLLAKRDAEEIFADFTS